MSDKKLLFEVEGFEVYSDSLYVVNNRVDYDAPSGFVERGTTQLPSDGVGETFYCPFIASGNSGEGVYDTGFYVNSPCYRTVKDTKSKELIVKNLKKNLVEPYANEKGAEDVSHNNLDFWDKQKFFITAGDVINSNNPNDLMKIYFALRHRKVCPKGLEKEPRFDNASYIVVDINKDVKKRDEKVSKQFRVIEIFTTLLKTDRARLVSLMEYVGIRTSTSVEDNTLTSFFYEYIQESESNIDRFIDLFEHTDTEVGRAEIDIYLVLKELRSDRKIDKAENGILFYNDIELGPNLKTAANNIARQKDFRELKRSLLLGEEIED